MDVVSIGLEFEILDFSKAQSAACSTMIAKHVYLVVYDAHAVSQTRRGDDPITVLQTTPEQVN